MIFTSIANVKIIMGLLVGLPTKAVIEGSIQLHKIAPQMQPYILESHHVCFHDLLYRAINAGIKHINASPDITYINDMLNSKADAIKNR